MNLRLWHVIMTLIYFSDSFKKIAIRKPNRIADAMQSTKYCRDCRNRYLFQTWVIRPYYIHLVLYSVTLDRFRKLHLMRYESAEACRVLVLVRRDNTCMTHLTSACDCENGYNLCKQEICRNRIKAGCFNVIIQDIGVHWTND